MFLFVVGATMVAMAIGWVSKEPHGQAWDIGDILFFFGGLYEMLNNYHHIH